MEPFAIYLIKSAVWLTGFFLIYIAVSSERTFFCIEPGLIWSPEF